MLKPNKTSVVPEETSRIAKAAFPKGNLYLRIRDEFGTLYQDEDFAELFPERGQPSLSPWRLAAVTVVQFLENLSDRGAADAVRARIDLEYLLGLELADPGFDYSTLSEFRGRLVQGKAEQVLLDNVLTLLQTAGLVKARSKQRTNATHVLASIRVLNRLELVGETLRAALNELAQEAPEWLRAVAEPAWFERYGRRVEDYRLPKSAEAKEKLGMQVAEDGFTLLAALAKGAPQQLVELDAVKTLRLVWQRHFVREAAGEGSRGLRWTTNEERFRSPVRLESPYDPEAKFSQKAGTAWVGYKVHLTETCDDGEAHLITDVLTTDAAKQDVSCTETVQRSLIAKNLTPGEHFVDAGYVDAGLLCSSSEKGIELIGPPRHDKSWQGRTEGAYDQRAFQIDWPGQQVTCPDGKQASSWKQHMHRDGYPFIQVRFRRADCLSCPSKHKCTRSNRRVLNLHLRDQYEALNSARDVFATTEGGRAYARRSGIEGTLSQGIRLCGLRTARYRGLAKTSLQHVATAVGINLLRVFDWLEGKPHASTRTSHFAALAVGF